MEEVHHLLAQAIRPPQCVILPAARGSKSKGFGSENRKQGLGFPQRG